MNSSELRKAYERNRPFIAHLTALVLGLAASIITFVALSSGGHEASSLSESPSAEDAFFSATGDPCSPFIGGRLNDFKPELGAAGDNYVLRMADCEGSFEWFEYSLDGKEFTPWPIGSTTLSLECDMVDERVQVRGHLSRSREVTRSTNRVDGCPPIQPNG